MNTRRAKFSLNERTNLVLALDGRIAAMRRMIEACDEAGEWRDTEERSFHAKQLATCESLICELRG